MTTINWNNADIYNYKCIQSESGNALNMNVVPFLKFELLMYYLIWTKEATTCHLQLRQVLSECWNYSSFYRRKRRWKKHTTIMASENCLWTLNSLKSWGAFLFGYRDLILKGVYTHWYYTNCGFLFALQSPPSFCASLFLLNPTELSAKLLARVSRIRCSIPEGTK